jgi:hypothetical protein
MGGVEALVVNTVRRGSGQMAGMGSMGLDLTSIADELTGGKVTDVQAQLDRLEIALKVSIVASVVAGVAGLFVLLRK